MGPRGVYLGQNTMEQGGPRLPLARADPMRPPGTLWDYVGGPWPIPKAMHVLQPHELGGRKAPFVHLCPLELGDQGQACHPTLSELALGLEHDGIA